MCWGEGEGRIKGEFQVSHAVLSARFFRYETELSIECNLRGGGSFACLGVSQSFISGEGTGALRAYFEFLDAIYGYSVRLRGVGVGLRL